MTPNCWVFIVNFEQINASLDTSILHEQYSNQNIDDGKCFKWIPDPCIQIFLSFRLYRRRDFPNISEQLIQRTHPKSCYCGQRHLVSLNEFAAVPRNCCSANCEKPQEPPANDLFFRLFFVLPWYFLGKTIFRCKDSCIEVVLQK